MRRSLFDLMDRVETAEQVRLLQHLSTGIENRSADTEAPLYQSALHELACSPPPLGIAMPGAATVDEAEQASCPANQQERWQRAAHNLNLYLMCALHAKLTCSRRSDSVFVLTLRRNCQVQRLRARHVWPGAPPCGVHRMHGRAVRRCRSTH